ncbi:MAG: Cytochrome c5 [uncultured Thiotrichaceae bacterium]|uniref:Cytochrome c5 n=1 Tax=uncultured Thiotrichaceae bacterium TaxID=298394 RepID=A0A6S6SBF7_9GAMM|nr:MAG: Cytochrome c5 [uncultured Thiotrichaceae bacterium]
MGSAYREKKVASTPNDPFAKPLLFGGLALLVAAVFVLVASLISTIEKNSTIGADDPAMIEKVAQNNLAPIGSVVAVDKTVAPIARTGEQVYGAVCTACHATGVLNAPKLEKAAWTDRIAKGLQGLTTSAINGLNQMPARGGDPSLTDEEMLSAVQYMTDQAGLGLTADAGEKTEAAAPAEKMTEAEPEATPAQAEAPAAPVAKAEPVVAAKAAPAEKAAAAHSSIDGQKIYQSICFSCHDSGVAGSPKPGDKAAWAPRLATGMSALYDSVLKGKGAMPAKGGNPALSDDEIKAAVDWMLAESQ